MTPEPVLSYEVRDRKAYVVLNRPQALNALSSELRRQLAAVFIAADQDDEIFVVILSGEGGRAFSAGADLKEAAQRVSALGGGAERPPSAHPRVAKPGGLIGFDQVDACSKPVIAAIDGYCLGGGLEIALYCDFRLATRKSVFGLPEPRRNLLSGPAFVQLSRMIPLGDALMMELTAEPISAERAYQIGLIQGVYEDRDALDQAVEKAADAILESPPLAVQFLKRIVKEGRDMTVEQHWKFAEMFAYELSRTEDAAEAFQAFAEKRKPNWKMR